MQLPIAVITLKDIVLLVLGWLFGLVGPIVVWKILNQRKAAAAREAVGYELGELKLRMVLAAYALHQDHGKFDRELLIWVRAQISHYRGANETTGLSTAIDSLLAETDEVIEQFAQSGRSPRKGKSIPIARMPYLESQLSEIHIFSAPDQLGLLQIMEHVSIFNETLKEARDYFDKTLDQSLSEPNRQIVDETLNTKYRHLAERAQIVARKIDELGV